MTLIVETIYCKVSVSAHDLADIDTQIQGQSVIVILFQAEHDHTRNETVRNPIATKLIEAKTTLDAMKRLKVLITPKRSSAK